MDKILSVIIPCYNSKDFLEKCLGSLVCEEIMDKLEVVLVNDGSTDGGEKIGESFAEKYPGTFRVLNKKNGGHGSAINAGAEIVSGKYMKVLDADDWFNTESLPDFVNALENATADVVLTFHHTVDISTGEIKCWRNFPDEFGKEYDMTYALEDWKRFDRSLTFHGITYRTDFYKEKGIKLSEGVFYEDHEYATFPCCYAKTILPLNLFVYEYRVGDVSQSVSSSNQVKRISHTIKVIRNMMGERDTLSDTVAKSYADKKTHLLLLSFLVTSLLCDKDRTRGYARARKMMQIVENKNSVVYNMTLNHYKILKGMNVFGINYQQYQKILHSKAYNYLRGNKDFE